MGKELITLSAGSPTGFGGKDVSLDANFVRYLSL